MQWNEYTTVGVPLIDSRNCKLADCLSNLRAAIRKQVCRYTIEDAIAFLEEYREVHFCEEEYYMKHYGYPGYDAHKERHRQFALEINYLKEELYNIKTLGLRGSYELSVETVQVISDWIHDHIMTEDGKLGAFLEKHACSGIDDISSLCGSIDYLPDGIVTICSICHKLRGTKGLWKKKEDYKTMPSDIIYSHSICPECLHAYYADLFQEIR